MNDTYTQLGTEIGELVGRKNAAYGDSLERAADALRLLYPYGLRPEQYLDAILAARDFDKRCRIAAADSYLWPDSEDPRLDIAGYALVGLAIHRSRNSEYQVVRTLSPERDAELRAMIERINARGAKQATVEPTEQPTERKDPAPCPGSASDPAAPEQRPAPADSAAPPTSGRTTTSASARTASDGLQPSATPSPSTSTSTAADAQTATVAAGPNANASRERRLRAIEQAARRNSFGQCASCTRTLPRGALFVVPVTDQPRINELEFCTRTCVDDFEREIARL